MLPTVMKWLALSCVLISCSRSDGGGASATAPTAIDARIADAMTIDAASTIDATSTTDAASTTDGAVPGGSGVMGSRPKTSRPKRKLGDAGAICRCNQDRSSGCVAVPCKPGLVCAYPCGVRGCHSVCMTEAEAERSKYRP